MALPTVTLSHGNVYYHLIQNIKADISVDVVVSAWIRVGCIIIGGLFVPWAGQGRQYSRFCKISASPYPHTAI